MTLNHGREPYASSVLQAVHHEAGQQALQGQHVMLGH